MHASERFASDANTNEPVAKALRDPLLVNVGTKPRETRAARSGSLKYNVTVRVAELDRDAPTLMHAAKREPRIHAVGSSREHSPSRPVWRLARQSCDERTDLRDPCRPRFDDQWGRACRDRRDHPARCRRCTHQQRSESTLSRPCDG